MGRVPDIACGACGATWPAARARFCGACGLPLAVPVAPRARLRPPGGGLRLAVGVVVAGAVAAGVVTIDRGLSAGAPEQGVSLPVPAEVAGSGLSREEAAAALVPFDATRVRCEPEGCERWRRALPGSWGAVAVVADQLVMVEDGELVAIDQVTGEDGWRRPIGGMVRAAGSGEHVPWRPRPGDVHLAGAGPHLIVTDQRGGVQLRDPDGHARWTIQLPVQEVWWTVPAGDRIMLAGMRSRSGQDETSVTAVAVGDGELLWARGFRHGDVYHISEHLVVVHADEQLHVLDPVTGDTRFAVSALDDAWIEVLGRWLVLRGGSAEPETPSADRLLDPSDGSVVAELPGVIDYPMVATDDGGVVAMVSDPVAGHALSAIAIEPDGSIAWQHEFGGDALDHACCRVIVHVGRGAVVVRPTGGATPVALDLVTGQPRPDVELPRLPADVWIQDGVAVAHRPDGMTIYDLAGGELHITGEGWPLLTDPPVLMTERELVGMGFVSPS